jgi:hypothetical protein
MLEKAAPMPEAQPLKSSSDLRAEMAQIDVDLAALDGRLTSCETRLRGSALLARRGDPTAVKLVAEARAAKLAIAVEVDLTHSARQALAAEVDAAIEREAAEARKAMSAEALAFAEVVEPIGAALDEALAKFREGFTDLKRRLHHAERRGYGPAGAVVQSALAQAVRAALWRISELGIPSPDSSLGRSFSMLTASWAGAARGGSQRLLMAPPALAPKPNGVNGAAHPASSKPAAERSIPRQVDLSERLPGDDPSFVVHEDRNAANAAIAAMAAGPGRKP